MHVKVKYLLKKKEKILGRNKGQITVRHLGGGYKKKFLE